MRFHSSSKRLIPPRACRFRSVGNAALPAGDRLRTRTCVVAITLSLAVLAGAPAPAPGETQPRGLSAAAAYKGWTVSSLEVQGLEKNLASQLSKGLVLSGKSKLLGRERASLYVEVLGQDISRARLFLARRGHPYAEIEPFYRPHSGSRSLDLTLLVRPGPAVRARHVSTIGFPPSTDKAASAAPAISPGSVFSETSLAATVQSLESVLYHAGHAKGRVTPSVERIDSTTVDLSFRADPGGVHTFGGVSVEGAPPDLVPLVKKTVHLERGTVYSPAILQEAEDYLRLLDLFGRVRLSTYDAAPRVLDLRAQLSVRKPRTFELKVGYWTDEQLKLGVRWRHRNLFEQGRSLSLEGSYSRFERIAGIALGWPALFGPRTWGSAGIGIERQREDSYNLDSEELELSGLYRPTLLTSVRAGVSVSNVDVDAKTEAPDAFIEQGGLLTYFSVEWNRDSSDDRLYPTKGEVTWLAAEWAPPGFLTESHYVSLQGSGTIYAPLGGGFVTAARLRAGYAEPLDDSVDLLPNKRFFAGGATSMRGFKRRKLGPLDKEEAPLGGASEVVASLELRFPFISRIGGALFVDAGQVWADEDSFSLDEIEVAVGPGLVVRTPIGPVRGDWGYRLTDYDKTQPRSVFHISIGHPF